MIKNYRDSNDYILALFRKSDRLSNGCLGLVYPSLFEKGSGQHRLCEDLLIGVSIRTKRRDRGTTEFFGLGSFTGIAIQFRQGQASFRCVALISKFLFQGDGIWISLLCVTRIRLLPQHSPHLSQG